MERRDETKTWLHELQDANPTLSISAILDLARLAVETVPPDDAAGGS